MKEPRHDCYCCFHFGEEDKTCRLKMEKPEIRCDQHVTIAQARKDYNDLKKKERG